MKSNAYLTFAFLKKKHIIKQCVVIGALGLIFLGIYFMQNKMYEGLEDAKEKKKEDTTIITSEPTVIPLQMSASQVAGPKGVYESQQESASRQNSLNNNNA